MVDNRMRPPQNIRRQGRLMVTAVQNIALVLLSTSVRRRGTRPEVRSSNQLWIYSCTKVAAKGLKRRTQCGDFQKGGVVIKGLYQAFSLYPSGATLHSALKNKGWHQNPTACCMACQSRSLGP